MIILYPHDSMASCTFDFKTYLGIVNRAVISLLPIIYSKVMICRKERGTKGEFRHSLHREFANVLQNTARHLRGRSEFENVIAESIVIILGSFILNGHRQKGEWYERRITMVLLEPEA